MCVLLVAGSCHAAEFEFDRSLPINLDADSSEFDRQANRLIFLGLRMTQGGLGIEADRGEAERLDFENSRWEFKGNVRIEREAEQAWCEDAVLFFDDHQLTRAEMTGEPVRFQQVREDEGLTEGQADNMEYDPVNGLVKMSGDAWISDGRNEVRGDRITYDLNKEQITAEGDASGQVRMKITPPEPDEQESPEDESAQ